MDILGKLVSLVIKSADIPDTENCALWITGLPAEMTYEQLLGSIRNVGKVHTTFINMPTSNHVASAAKIVFFNHRAAERLFQAIQGGIFSVMNQAVRNVRWNRIKSAPYQATDQSRAIKITGPSDSMDIIWFKSFFDRRFLYQLEYVIQERSTRPGKDTQIWRFASVRCQEAWAKLAIERELRGIFTVD